MKFINSLKERFTKEQLMIIATALSLSTPFYICVPFLLLETLYLLYTKKIINAFKSTPKSKYLIIFMLLTLAISLIYQNWIGVGCVALIFIFVSLMLYYRQYINEDTFEFILDMLIALSILWAIYGLFEQIQILDRLGYDHFTLKVFSRRENRLNSVFFNANYYAMMIEFTIMMIGYKIFGTKNVKKQLYYFIVACLNFFLLYMTGCRTAFVATAGAMLVFLIINKNYRICSLIGLLCIIDDIISLQNKYYKDKDKHIFSKEAVLMNKLALVAISLFVVVEILVGDCVVQGIPLWVVGLIGFSLIWMGIICVKEKVQIKDWY